MSTAASPDPVAELAARVRAAQLPPPATRRRIREEAGLSLRQVAAALEVDVNTLHRWERGSSQPRHRHAVRYRHLLDVLDEAAKS
jgi:DNA-binding transcriptional regulator YiaG